MARRIFPPYNLDDFGGALVTTFGSFPYTVTEAIMLNADTCNRSAIADLAIALVESAWTLNPFLEVHTEPGEVAGSNGEDSYGVINIETGQNSSRRPGSQWLGFDGLRRSLEFVNPRWSSAWATRGDWNQWALDFYSFQASVPGINGSKGYHELAQGSIPLDIRTARLAIVRAMVLRDEWHKRRFADYHRPPVDPRIATYEAGLGLASQGLDDLTQYIAAQKAGIANVFSQAAAQVPSPE